MYKKETEEIRLCIHPKLAIFASGMRRSALPILLLLFIPLFLINMQDVHDWGDDFAQYLIQAKNIAENRPQTENGVIQQADFGNFAVKAYPLGFPLILTPIYILFGLHIKAYLVLESCFLFLLGILIWKLFRERLQVFVALFAVLLFVYHPATLDLKGQILSEIPFCFFLYFILLRLGKSYNLAEALICGLALGMLCSVRIIGLIMVPAIILFLAFGRSGPPYYYISFKKKLMYGSLLLLTGLSVFLMMNVLCFDIQLSDFFGFYRQALETHVFQLKIQLAHYSDVLAALFVVPEILQPYRGLLLAVLILSGWYLTFKNRRSPDSFFFPLYLFVLLAYPYSGGTFRFLLPVVPLFILYILEVLKGIPAGLSGNPDNRPQLLFILILLIAYVAPLMEYKSGTAKKTEGPLSGDGKTMMEYVRNNTAPESVILFPRARAMALFGERQSSYVLEDKSLQDNYKALEQLGSYYIVLPQNSEHNPVYSEYLNNYYLEYSNEFEKIWNNASFSIFRKKQ